MTNLAYANTEELANKGLKRVTKHLPADLMKEVKKACCDLEIDETEYFKRSLRDSRRESLGKKRLGIKVAYQDPS